MTERASPSSESNCTAIISAFVRADVIAVPFVFWQRPCPLRRSAPALPKGEPLAGRATSCWTPEARYDVKGRALLQRAAASGQYPLSSCRESRQRSTPVSEKIRLCSSRVGLTDSPEAPLLGELANEVRLRGCTKTEPDREPLLDSTSPSRLTPCHLPYRGEALAVPAK